MSTPAYSAFVASVVVLCVIPGPDMAYLLGRTVTQGRLTSADTRSASARRIFWEGFLSDALNPKVSIFFLAFLPQFVDTSSRVGIPMQLLLLGVACNVIALSINVVLVLLAGPIGRAAREHEWLQRWMNRLLGGLFVALGLRLASEKF